MSKKVGVGIIGTGFAPKVQIPGFAACDGAEIVSVASASLENARSTAEEFGIEHFTDDWREAVAHADVDLVCITTPPNLHREMVLTSLENGKHVLAEKPMAMSVGEAEEMTAAAEKVKVFALIDHELRFQPGRQLAHKILREGAIGKVRHAKWNFRAPARGDANLPWNWWSDETSGGGALGAINSHIIDSFHWLLGAEIASVYCQLHSHIKQRPYGDKMRAVTTDDEANMILRFADSDVVEDATGLVSVSMVEQPGYLNRVELFGSDGAIRIDHRGDVFIAQNGEKEWREISVDLGTVDDRYPDTGFGRGFYMMAPKLIEAIATGRTEIEYAATFHDGLKVQRVLDAARESDRQKKDIAVASMAN